jgi:hypothetical protein
VKPSLVILAAGVGSRYGGLKQLDPVGPGGAALMDYTMYDALHSGFERVVLVIRRETEAEIRAHIEAGAARRLEVHFAHQELDRLPEGFAVRGDRSKPWGTGHAVLMAAPYLEGPFVAANADDFYGRRAVAALARYLGDTAGAELPHWAMVGYRLGETLPASGRVSRAVCVRDEDGWMLGLKEILAIERVGDSARWQAEGGATRIEPLDTLVSMNLWGFTVSLMGHLERGFRGFLEAGPGPKDEFYLPVAVAEAVRAGAARVKILDEGGRWCGMTSPEDRAATAEVLRELVDAGEYPEQLWE